MRRVLLFAFLIVVFILESPAILAFRAMSFMPLLMNASSVDRLARKIPVTRARASLSIDDDFMRVIANDIKDLKTAVNGLKVDLDEFKRNQSALNNQIMSNQPLWNNGGEAYAYFVRQRLGITNGIDYSTNYMIDNLVSLAAVALPEDFENPEETLMIHTQQLVNIAMERLEIFRPALSLYPSFSSSAEKEHGKILKAYYDAFDKCTDNERSKFLAFEPLGLILFSTMIFEADPQKRLPQFLHKVEIDIKGQHLVIDDLVFHHIGECKHGHDKKLGHHQLLLRLALINAATQTVLDCRESNNAPRPRVALKGTIYNSVPNWVKPSTEDLDGYISELALKPTYLHDIYIDQSVV